MAIFSSSGYKLMFTIILGTLSLFHILVTFAMFQSICSRAKYQPTTSNRQSRRCSTGSIHFLSLVSILLFSASTYGTLTSIHFDIDGMNRASGIAYILAQWLMLLSFVIRIHFTFKDSMMEYGRIVIIPLYIGCALSFFLLILIGGGFFFDLEIWFMISVMSLWAIVYVLFAMILMVLFVRRIERAMITIFRHRLADMRKGTDCVHSDELLDSDMIDTSIRYSLLVVIAIMTSMITYSSAIVLHYYLRDSMLKNVAFCVAMADGLVSSICMLLFHPKHLAMYKMVCKPAHRACRSVKKRQIYHCSGLTMEEKQQFKELML